MKKSASISRLALVPLRALLLVGLLCAPSLALADSTNTIEFVYREDFEIYRAQVTNQCAHIISDCASIDDDLTSAMEAAGWAHDRVQSAMSVIPEDPYGDQTQYEACYGYLEDASSYIVQCEQQIYAAKEQLWQIERSARNINSFMVSFHTFNDDGGCSCPDYTIILTNIRLQLNSILSYAQDWNEFIIAHYDFYTSISGGFLGNLTGDDPYWATEYDLGVQVGRWLGTFASNNWDYVYYANLYPQIGNGIFDPNGVRTGPRFLQEMWNYILRPIAQTWVDYEWDPNNRMIHGFRDFFIGDHVVAVTNEPINPIWVQFTNSVSLSDETLDALTNTFFSLDQLMQSLTNAVFMVTWDEETMEKQQDVEKEQTQLAADEAEAQNSDPDADNVDLPTTDISGVSGIATHVSSVVSSYKAMFTTIPHDLPDDILIHEGWVMRMPSLGNTRAVGDDFEVESIHWRPGDDSTLSRLLSGMRGLFVGLWLLVFIAVIWGAMSIDLFIAGVCIYCTYGLLLGKPETTLKGIRFMFRLLCSLLGRDPPK